MDDVRRAARRALDADGDDFAAFLRWRAQRRREQGAPADATIAELTRRARRWFTSRCMVVRIAQLAGSIPPGWGAAPRVRWRTLSGRTAAWRLPSTRGLTPADGINSTPSAFSAPRDALLAARFRAFGIFITRQGSFMRQLEHARRVLGRAHHLGEFVWPDDDAPLDQCALSWAIAVWHGPRPLGFQNLYERIVERELANTTARPDREDAERQPGNRPLLNLGGVQRRPGQRDRAAYDPARDGIAIYARCPRCDLELPLLIDDRTRAIVFPAHNAERHNDCGQSHANAQALLGHRTWLAADLGERAGRPLSDGGDLQRAEEALRITYPAIAAMRLAVLEQTAARTAPAVATSVDPPGITLRVSGDAVFEPGYNSALNELIYFHGASLTAFFGLFGFMARGRPRACLGCGSDAARYVLTIEGTGPSGRPIEAAAGRVCLGCFAAFRRSAELWRASAFEGMTVRRCPQCRQAVMPVLFEGRAVLALHRDPDSLLDNARCRLSGHPITDPITQENDDAH